MSETKDRRFGPWCQEICDIGDKVSVYIIPDPAKRGTIIERTLYPIEPTKGVFSYYVYSIELEDGSVITATSGDVRKLN